ncbi:hypothetical protein ACFPOI_35205 [Nonomuraea angiospora]|uniref:Uncharacterized protein n=1 Tax=Nonomuraea angiospora TaxID=46172 RepID=A0ABR9M8C0_9ACTN|nr:hypothetical protein [Nonomuraea angiospora]MBE1589164.1 hypothetical protein [Nonomuraea angiospora]
MIPGFVRARGDGLLRYGFVPPGNSEDAADLVQEALGGGHGLPRDPEPDRHPENGYSTPPSWHAGSRVQDAKEYIILNPAPVPR